MTTIKIDRRLQDLWEETPICGHFSRKASDSRSIQV